MASATSAITPANLTAEGQAILTALGLPQNNISQIEASANQVKSDIPIFNSDVSQLNAANPTASNSYLDLPFSLSFDGTLNGSGGAPFNPTLQLQSDEAGINYDAGLANYNASPNSSTFGTLQSDANIFNNDNTTFTNDVTAENAQVAKDAGGGFGSIFLPVFDAIASIVAPELIPVIAAQNAIIDFAEGNDLGGAISAASAIGGGLTGAGLGEIGSPISTAASAAGLGTAIASGDPLSIATSGAGLANSALQTTNAETDDPNVPTAAGGINDITNSLGLTATNNASGTGNLDNVSGTSGADNVSGANGINNISGVTLPNVSGTSGTDNVSGTSGVNNVSGTSGVNNVSGTSGKNKASGTNTSSTGSNVLEGAGLASTLAGVLVPLLSGNGNSNTGLPDNLSPPPGTQAEEINWDALGNALGLTDVFNPAQAGYHVPTSEGGFLSRMGEGLGGSVNEYNRGGGSNSSSALNGIVQDLGQNLGQSL